jgi:hypothetical protein
MQHAFPFLTKPSRQNLRDPRNPALIDAVQSLEREITEILKQSAHIQTLSENVWQIPLQNGLKPLSQMLVAIEKAGLESRVLLVEGELNWLT